ncbi:hypothetical protein H4582DRAFT_2061146 [Lactarius indigo]|nr:hypothetical protein H4582DRAFT_2061146 [Lactarius indigo]
MALLLGQLTSVLNSELFPSPFNRFCIVRQEADHPVVFTRRNRRTQRPPPTFRSSPLNISSGCNIVMNMDSWSETPEECMTPPKPVQFNTEFASTFLFYSLVPVNLQDVAKGSGHRAAKACLGPKAGHGGAVDTHQKTDVHDPGPAYDYSADARLPRARSVDVARTRSEKGAEMTQACCGFNHQARLLVQSAPRTRGKAVPDQWLCPSQIERIRNKGLPIREAWITTTLSGRPRTRAWGRERHATGPTDWGMDEVGRLTRRSGAFTVREEDAELGYGQGGGNVSCDAARYRGDERSASCGGAGRGRSSLKRKRRRRMSQTKKEKRHAWMAHDAQSRKHKVPGSSDSWSWKDPKLRCTAVGNMLRVARGQSVEKLTKSEVSTFFRKILGEENAGCLTKFRDCGCSLTLVARPHGRLVAYSGNENRIGLRGARDEDQSGGCVHGLGWKDGREKIESARLVISAKVERMSGGERRPAGKNKMQHQRAVHARAGD